MSVALVTDSTAYLSRAVVDLYGVAVVPLHVVIAGEDYSEGVDVTSAEVAAALRSFAPVSTSRPSPSAFLRAYEAAAAGGADAIVSVHISADMSSTIDSARLAAEQSPVPVTVVDSRSMGMAMGYAVLSACDAARAGASQAEVAEVARRRAADATVVFYVDTLEHLRRGGRIGAASALLGSALAIKPILALADGHIRPLERVRTSVRALSRIEELAVTAAKAAPHGVDIAVHHLDSQARADQLAGRLADRLHLRRQAVDGNGSAARPGGSDVAGGTGVPGGGVAGGGEAPRGREAPGGHEATGGGEATGGETGTTMRTGPRAAPGQEPGAAREGPSAGASSGAVTGEASGRRLGVRADSGVGPSGERPGALVVVELGAVVGAHVGPGTLAVVVSPRPGE